jgi:von Willebrand factor type A domain/Aerotolerance regulator N-terminal
MSAVPATVLAVTWVTPLAGAILGAAVLAPLLALWFLKLRRKRRVVSSTLLWTRSLADLRANAPFQRIRFNLLLLLQILAVLAIAIAVAQPEAEGLGSAGGRHVLMIDRSASMGAIETVDGSGRALDAPISRLALAKDAAKARVRELLGGGWFSTSASDVMVVSFGSRAEIKAPFTDSIAALETAIDAITPSDEATRIADAMELARAFTDSANRGDTRGERVELDTSSIPTIELYSDGRVSDIGGLSLRTGERIIYHRVGEAANNAAVVAISAERPPESPDKVQVFASVANPMPEPRSVTLQLAVDGTVRSITPKPVEIAAALDRDGQFVPGRAQVTFRPIEQPSNASIEVAIVEDDALRADDAALAVVAPAKRLSVLLVGSGGFVVKTLLEGLSIERFNTMTADEFDAAVAESKPLNYDVVVFDGVAAKKLPAGRYLAFGAVPPVAGLSAYGEHKGVYPRSVRDEHPVFRSAGLDELFVSKMTAVQADRSFQVLAESPEGPMVLALDKADLHVLYVAFDPLDSNWPFQRSFVNFTANAVEHLGRAGDAIATAGVRPGEPIALRLPAGSRDVDILVPDGTRAKVVPDAEGNIAWGPATVAGLYRIEFLVAGLDSRQTRLVAVNIADPAESRIAPLPELNLGNANVQGINVSASRRGALWPWVLALGLLVVVIEWWYYQRQVRL